jgi:SAM-dependent methyltransferase
MNESGLAFAQRQLTPEIVRGAAILEVGSFDTTGSVRPHAESLQPASYLGVDIASGPRVDELCDVRDLLSRFGPERFDVVIATELVEHVRDWRAAFRNLKGVLRVGGWLLITTRSRGFRYHFGPDDWWRYEPEDLSRIAADFDDLRIERDPDAPGVFLAAAKSDRDPVDLGDIGLYSMVTGRRSLDVTDAQVRWFRRTNWRIVGHRLPRRLRAVGRRALEFVLRKEL